MRESHWGVPNHIDRDPPAAIEPSTGGNQDNLATWLKDLDFIQFAYSVDKRDAEKERDANREIARAVRIR